MEDKIEFDPSKNPDMISIWKDWDGNYCGRMQKNGKLLDERQVKPEDVLVKLLTHE
jgi:hypothetical protein